MSAKAHSVHRFASTVTLAVPLFALFAGSGAGDESAAPPGPEVAWQIDLGEGSKQIAFGTDGTLYVVARGEDATLTALTPGGDVLWSWVSHRAKAMTAPLLGPEGHVHVVFGDRLAKFASGGRMLWTKRFYTTASTPGARGREPGMALAADGTSYVAAAYLTALAADGTLKWQLHTGEPLAAPRLVGRGDIEVTDGEKTYTVSALGAKVRDARNPTGAQFAARGGGTVYRLGWVAMETRRLGFNQLLAERDGVQVWDFTPGRPLLNAAPAGDTVYVGGELLAALDVPSGRVRWRFDTNPVPAQATRSGVVGGCEKSSLVCAYDRDGRLQWAYGEGGRGYATRMTAFVGPDGTVYVADQSKTLTALRDAAAPR